MQKVAELRGFLWQLQKMINTKMIFSYELASIMSLPVYKNSTSGLENGMEKVKWLGQDKSVLS